MFASHHKGAFQLTFKNGTKVSVIWCGGTYSDNHMKFDDILGQSLDPSVSGTAELMVLDDPTGRGVRYVEKQYGNNPAGYLSVDDVIDIFNYLRILN